MMNRFKIKKGTILTLMFWGFVIGLVVYQNGWLVMLKTSSVQEKLIQKKKENKKETKIVEKKKVKSKKKTRIASTIYLPTPQTAIKKLERKKIDDNDQKPVRKLEKLLERKEHLAFKEQPVPVNAEKEEKRVPEILAVQPEDKPKVAARKVAKKPVTKPVSLSEVKNVVKEPLKIVKNFDFRKYRANLINNYKVRKGERVPLLFIDDHGKSKLYKQGLSFYGYQLIARPEVKSGKPYYFIINNSGMERIDKAWPYGSFPSALLEDRNLFRNLLSQPQFAGIPNCRYELFYAPLDTRMIAILESKLKLIIEENNVTANEISRMIGTFKEIEDSYILIIETVIMIDEKRLYVRDPDNVIVAVR
ncbi:MAG: hypothetical protein NUV86_00060 [Candidatus Scalindua sp.]|nr:hypothetical protein [Candidatus Scalindua sp.]MCR4345058.1 hypothetical protein [Candidatus Scalindua sp.]